MGNNPPEPSGGTQPPFHCNPGFCRSGLWAGPGGGRSSFLLCQVWAPLERSAGVTTGGFSVQLGLPHSLATGCGELGMGLARGYRVSPDLVPGGTGCSTFMVLCWLKKAQVHSVSRGGDIWKSGRVTSQKSICNGRQRVAVFGKYAAVWSTHSGPDACI